MARGPGHVYTVCFSVYSRSQQSYLGTLGQLFPATARTPVFSLSITLSVCCSASPSCTMHCCIFSSVVITLCKALTTFSSCSLNLTFQSSTPVWDLCNLWVIRGSFWWGPGNVANWVLSLSASCLLSTEANTCQAFLTFYTPQMCVFT